MTSSAPNTVALVLVGDELLTGHTIDTNGPWLGRRLTEEGLQVGAATIAPDDADAVVRAIEHGLEAARAVLVTGGLGPTPDDVTRAARPLARPLGERRAGQRCRNRAGRTAGVEPGRRVCRPGVPAEMRAMVSGQVLPEIVTAAEPVSPRSTRSLIVVGLPESRVAELLTPVREYLGDRGRLSYLPQPAEVEVLIGSTGNDASTLAAAAAARARQLLGDAVAAENQRLEEAVVQVLGARGVSVATAESLTVDSSPRHSCPSRCVRRGARRSGGLRHRPEGRSPGRRPDLLQRDGAVAPTTATAMAEGIRTRCRADFGVATTGVAGPDPQEGHPAGTMHVAVASDAGPGWACSSRPGNVMIARQCAGKGDSGAGPASPCRGGRRAGTWGILTRSDTLTEHGVRVPRLCPPGGTVDVLVSAVVVEGGGRWFSLDA